jgi:hypothetical protein
MANHGLRTTGTHTGNFGRAKVQAGARLNDIGHTNAEVVNITTPGAYMDRLLEAYHKTGDVKLRRFIYNELQAECIRSGKTLKRVDHSGRTADPYKTPGC